MPPWYHSSLAYTTTRRVAVGGGKVSEEKPPVNMQFLHTRNRTPALLIGNQIPIALPQQIKSFYAPATMVLPTWPAAH